MAPEKEPQARRVTPQGIITDLIVNPEVASIIAAGGTAQAETLLTVAGEKANSLPPHMRASMVKALVVGQLRGHEFWDATRRAAASQLIERIDLSHVPPPILTDIEASKAALDAQAHGPKVTSRRARTSLPTTRTPKHLSSTELLTYVDERPGTEDWHIAEDTGFDSVKTIDERLRELRGHGFLTSIGIKPESGQTYYTYTTTSAGAKYIKYVEKLTQSEAGIEDAEIVRARRDVVLLLATNGYDAEQIGAALDVAPEIAVNDLTYLEVVGELNPQEEADNIWADIFLAYLSKTQGVIAQETGLTSRAVSAAVFRARERGEDIPYKRPDRVPEEVMERRERRRKEIEEQRVVRRSLVANIARLREADVPEAEIAERLDIPLGTVRSIATDLREKGFVEKRHAGALAAGDEQQFNAILIDLWGQGLTVREIRERVGEGYATRVSSHLTKLQENGVIEQRKAGPRLSEEGLRQRSEVRSLMADGIVDPETIRDRTGIRLDKVRRHVSAVEKEQPREEVVFDPTVVSPDEDGAFHFDNLDTEEGTGEYVLEVGVEEVIEEQPDMQERRGYRGTTEEYD